MNNLSKTNSIKVTTQTERIKDMTTKIKTDENQIRNEGTEEMNLNEYFYIENLSPKDRLIFKLRSGMLDGIKRSPNEIGELLGTLLI